MTLAQEREVSGAVESAEKGLPARGQVGKRLAQAAPEKELVGIETGKSLEFDQARGEAAVFPGADREIDRDKERVRILVRHDQPWRNRILGVSAELRRLHLGDELARRARDLPGEFRGEKDRRFRDAKISRPDFGLVHRPDEGGILFLREVGVKPGALG